jgi:hypothetical protein
MLLMPYCADVILRHCLLDNVCWSDPKLSNKYIPDPSYWETPSNFFISIVTDTRLSYRTEIAVDILQYGTVGTYGSVPVPGTKACAKILLRATTTPPLFTKKSPNPHTKQKRLRIIEYWYWFFIKTKKLMQENTL